LATFKCLRMVSVPSGGDTWIYDGYEANLKLTTKDRISSVLLAFSRQSRYPAAAGHLSCSFGNHLTLRTLAYEKIE
jgi:hypothetical protein